MSAPFGLPVRSPAADRLVDDGDRARGRRVPLPGARDPRPQPRLGRLHHGAVRSADRLRRRRPLRGFRRPDRLRRRLPAAPLGHPLEALRPARRDPGLPRPRPGHHDRGGAAVATRSSATQAGSFDPVMNVWAISDLHLSFGRPERRDRYAARWRDHAEQDRAGLARGRPAGGRRPPARRPVDGPEPSRGPARPGMARGAARHQGPRPRQSRSLVERRGARPPDPAPPDGRRGRRRRGRRRHHRLRRRAARRPRPTTRTRPIGSPPTAPSGRWSRAWTMRRDCAATAIGPSTSSGITRPSTHGRPGPWVERFERAGVTACVYGHLHIQAQWSTGRPGHRPRASATTASPPTPSASGPSGSTAESTRLEPGRPSARGLSRSAIGLG